MFISVDVFFSALDEHIAYIVESFCWKMSQNKQP